MSAPVVVWELTPAAALNLANLYARRVLGDAVVVWPPKPETAKL